MQLSRMKLSRKKKEWMQECKALIKELSASLAVKTAENQDLSNSTKDLEEQLTLKEQRLKQQKQRILQVEQQNSTLKIALQSIKVRSQVEKEQDKLQLKSKMEEMSQAQLKIQELQRKRHQFQTLNRQIDIKNRNFELKTRQLEDKLTQKQRKICQQEKAIGNLKGLLLAAQNHIDFLKNQVQLLRTKVADQQKSYQKELQSLRDLNANITQKLSLIEKDYSQIINSNNDSITTYQSPKKRNEWKRSTTKRQKRAFRERQHRGNRQREDMNPQMEQQLIKIKRSISDQYGKLSDKRDKLMKDRVSKTLVNIQSLLSEMSDKVHVDSSSYEL